MRETITIPDSNNSLRREKTEDIRDKLFAPLKEKKFLAELRTKEPGVIAGVKNLQEKASKTGIKIKTVVKDGNTVEKGVVS